MKSLPIKKEQLIKSFGYLLGCIQPKSQLRLGCNMLIGVLLPLSRMPLFEKSSKEQEAIEFF